MIIRGVLAVRPRGPRTFWISQWPADSVDASPECLGDESIAGGVARGFLSGVIMQRRRNGSRYILSPTADKKPDAPEGRVFIGPAGLVRGTS